MFRSFYKECKRTQERFVILKITQKNTRTLRSFELNILYAQSCWKRSLSQQIYCTVKLFFMLSFTELQNCTVNEMYFYFKHSTTFAKKMCKRNKYSAPGQNYLNT